MNQFPFGFRPGGGSDDPNDFDLASIGTALQQLATMMQADGGLDSGPINWEMARQATREAISKAGDPSVSDSQRRSVAEAIRLADLWLDSATEFPAVAAPPAAWSRSEWLEATLPAWQQIIAPVAEGMASTMAQIVPLGPGEGAGFGGGVLPAIPGLPGLPPGLPAELGSNLGPLLKIVRAMGAAMFGMQAAKGLAALAGEVLGAADVGVPLTQQAQAALIPENLAAFGDGLGLPEDEVRLFAALREAAHQRLFAHVPWLRARAEGAIQAYASKIKIDQDRIAAAMLEGNPQHPEEFQQVLASGVFQPEDSEEQRAALARLETILALTEGWVDAIVHTAASERLPSYEQLREVLRRRRAAGGPAEKTFATLIGLELRPRRLREAASLWTAMNDSYGMAGRDALWGHPDLLPTAEDFDDIPGFVQRCAPETP